MTVSAQQLLRSEVAEQVKKISKSLDGARRRCEAVGDRNAQSASTRMRFAIDALEEAWRLLLPASQERR